MHKKHLTIDVVISLKKLPNTLIELELYEEEHYLPLSFIANLTNLQNIITICFLITFASFKIQIRMSNK